MAELIDDYKPNQRWYVGPTPQSRPELFTDRAIMREVKYLMLCNRRFGQNEIRTAKYLSMMNFVEARKRLVKS